MDLRELDVRCELSPVQAEQVSVDQSAEVWLDGKPEAAGTGKVVLISKTADRNTGLVLVVIRLPNPQERFRADYPSRFASQPRRKNSEAGQMLAWQGFTIEE